MQLIFFLFSIHLFYIIIFIIKRNIRIFDYIIHITLKTPKYINLVTFLTLIFNIQISFYLTCFLNIFLNKFINILISSIF